MVLRYSFTVYLSFLTGMEEISMCLRNMCISFSTNYQFTYFDVFRVLGLFLLIFRISLS